MKVIIAGGRANQLGQKDRLYLDNIDISEVVSGCAPGIDASGERYAGSRGLPVKRFPANWKQFKNAAGPIRNREMAQYADAVVLFPGGKGTRSMHHEAVKAGIKIYDKRTGR